MCLIKKRVGRGREGKDTERQRDRGWGRQKTASPKQEIKTMQEINIQRYYIRHIKMKNLVVEVKIKINPHTVLMRNLWL